MANEKLIALSEVKKKITAVRQYFSGYPSTDQDKLARSVAKLCMEEVGKIKPVDAVPVVHGRWVNIVDYGDGNCYGFCSACAAEQKAQSGTALKAFHRYCRWCGAKMDGEGSETDGN